MRLAIALLAVLLVALQARLWLVAGGVPEVWRLQEAVAGQRAENQRLAERNDALAADVRDLKSGLAAVEERARQELGMIREGEVFYRIVDGGEQ